MLQQTIQPKGRLSTRARALLSAALLLALPGCQWAAQGQNAEGVRMFQQAYYQGALQRFQQAIQSDPKNADGYYNLAATHHRLGTLQQQKSDLIQAENYYHLCLDNNTDHPDCHRGLAVLLFEQGRKAEAFRLLQGWAGRSPTLAAPHIELARLYEESGDREAAKQQLVEAISVEPSNARALAALGKLREESGNTMQALADYQRSLSINRFQPQVAARVQSLQSALAAPGGTTPGGTRIVSTPGTPLR